MATFRVGLAANFSTARLSANFNAGHLTGLGLRNPLSLVTSGALGTKAVVFGKNPIGQSPTFESRLRLFLQPENLLSRLQLARAEDPARFFGYAGLAAMFAAGVLGISWEVVAGMVFAPMSTRQVGDIRAYVDTLNRATDEALLIQALCGIEKALVTDFPDSERIDEARISIHALMVRPGLSGTVYRMAQLTSEDLDKALPGQASRQRIRGFVGDLVASRKIGPRLPKVEAEVEAALLNLCQDVLLRSANLEERLKRLDGFQRWDHSEFEAGASLDLRARFLTERLREYLALDHPEKGEPLTNEALFTQVLGLTTLEAHFLDIPLTNLFPGPESERLCGLLDLRRVLDRLHERLLYGAASSFLPQSSGSILRNIFSWVPSGAERTWETVRSYLTVYPEILYFRQNMGEFFQGLKGDSVRLRVLFDEFWKREVEIPTVIRSLDPGREPWKEQVAAFQKQLAKLAKIPGEARQREVLDAVFSRTRTVTLGQSALALEQAMTACWFRHGSEIVREKRVRRAREAAADRKEYDRQSMYEVYQEISRLERKTSGEQVQEYSYATFEGMLKTIDAYYFSDPDRRDQTHLDPHDFSPSRLMSLNKERLYRQFESLVQSLSAEISELDSPGARRRVGEAGAKAKQESARRVIAALEGLSAILRVIRG